MRLIKYGKINPQLLQVSIIDSNGNRISSMGWSIDVEGFISADSGEDLAAALDFYQKNPGQVVKSHPGNGLIMPNPGIPSVAVDPNDDTQDVYVSEYNRWKNDGGNVADKPKCNWHDWVIYRGFTEVYEYCSRCDEKREYKDEKKKTKS